MEMASESYELAYRKRDCSCTVPVAESDSISNSNSTNSTRQFPFNKIYLKILPNRDDNRLNARSTNCEHLILVSSLTNKNKNYNKKKFIPKKYSILILIILQIKQIFYRLNRCNLSVFILLIIALLTILPLATGLTGGDPAASASASAPDSESASSSSSLSSSSSSSSSSSLSYYQDPHEKLLMALDRTKFAAAPEANADSDAASNTDAANSRDPSRSYPLSSCHSCILNEQVEADNVESIKRHIMLRLDLTSVPNITAPIVPASIIEKFYQHASDAAKPPAKSAGRRDPPPSSKSVELSYDSMQGDDPDTYAEYENNNWDRSRVLDHDRDEYEAENYSDEFYSVLNSLFLFPTVPRMRHNRKQDILHFAFNNEAQAAVSQATMHVYVRGWQWIREQNDVSLIENALKSQEISFTVNRVLRRQNSTNSTHVQKVANANLKIPANEGAWVKLNVTEMVAIWFKNFSTNTNHGVVFKTLEPWMKLLIVTDDSAANKALSLYIDVKTRDNRKRRAKRSMSIDCPKDEKEKRCCRHPLTVNFHDFDWMFIVAPTSFEAYYCNGECEIGYLSKYSHTHILYLSTAPKPCCSPTKMSPLRMLYFTSSSQLMLTTIPNMVVEKCSCS